MNQQGCDRVRDVVNRSRFGAVNSTVFIPVSYQLLHAQFAERAPVRPFPGGSFNVITGRTDQGGNQFVIVSDIFIDFEIVLCLFQCYGHDLFPPVSGGSIACQHNQRIEINRFAVGNHDGLSHNVIGVIVFINLHGYGVVGIEDIVLHSVNESKYIGFLQCGSEGRQVVAENYIAAQQHTGRNAVHPCINACDWLTIGVCHTKELHEGRFIHDPYRSCFISLWNSGLSVYEGLIIQFGNIDGDAFGKVVQNAGGLAGTGTGNDSSFKSYCHSFCHIGNKYIFESGKCHVFSFKGDGYSTAQFEMAESDGAQSFILFIRSSAFSHPFSYRLYVRSRDDKAGLVRSTSNERQDVAIGAQLFNDTVKSGRRNDSACISGGGSRSHFLRNRSILHDVVHECLAVFIRFIWSYGGFYSGSRFFSFGYAFRFSSQIDCISNLFTGFNVFLFSVKLFQFSLQCFQVYLFISLQSGADFFFSLSDFYKSLVHFNSPLQECLYNELLSKLRFFFTAFKALNHAFIVTGLYTCAVIRRKINRAHIYHCIDVIDYPNFGFGHVVRLPAVFIHCEGKGHFRNVSPLNELVDIFSRRGRCDIGIKPDAFIVSGQSQCRIGGSSQNQRAV
nr:MAG TPA: hypothetical protein [Caudoviricetes sp.]